MAHQPPTSIDRVREIADSLNCLIEEDFQALADVKPGTAEAWRKRGHGPSYIRLGNRYLYPKRAVAEHIETLVRDRVEVPAKGFL